MRLRQGRPFRAHFLEALVACPHQDELRGVRHEPVQLGPFQLPGILLRELLPGPNFEAAQDLGCPPSSAFWKVTFPLSLPGVIAGCLLVFIPAVGEFVIPDLLGGSQTLMIGKTLWNEFFANRDWPVSSAVAVILLLLLVIPIMIFQQAQARAQES